LRPDCPLLPSKARLPVGSLGGVAGSWPDGWPQAPSRAPVICQLAAWEGWQGVGRMAGPRPRPGHLSFASWQREMAREEARGGPVPWGGR
jgi:hypothetical protein